MTFRLVTLLYLFALLAASLAVFGAWGILVTGLVFGTWHARNRSASWWFILRYSWVLLILLLLIVLLLPAVTDIRTPSLRTASLNHTKQLLLAILNYESVNGHLPPVYVTDAEGTPLYSWRVAILPYIEGDAIYKQLHLDKPWDSPHNRPLLDQVDSSLFASPRVRGSWEGDGTTDYVAIVDSATLWPEESTVALREVVDGPSDTIALIEVGGLDIHWTEPRDVTLDEAVDLLTGQPTHLEEAAIENYFTTEVYELRYRVVGYLDGHAMALGPLKHREIARALLTKAERENLEGGLEQLDEPYPSRHVRTIIHWDHIWGVTVWLALVLLPSVPAARRRIWPTSGDAKREEQEVTEKAEEVWEH